MNLRHTVIKSLDAMVSRWGYRLRKKTALTFFETLLYRRLRKTDNFFFIHIGANDGVMRDELYAFVTQNKVRGLVVEPLPDIYQELVRNYSAHPQVIPVNAALHASASEQVLYRVDPTLTGLPEWMKGIASFDSEHHKKSNTPGAYIIEEKVPCLSLQELLDRHEVTRVDLLKIDTEGYDYEIVKMIDFERIKPMIIRFEHGHWHQVMGKDRLRDLVLYLYDQGYFIVMEPYDAVAYIPGLSDGG